MNDFFRVDPAHEDMVESSPPPRPYEPKIKKPCVLSLQGWILLTRVTAAILVFIWGLILISCMSVFYQDADECEACKHVDAVRVDEIRFGAGRTYQNREFIYRLLEYKLYDKPQKNGTKKHDIIVIYIPGNEESPLAQQNLARIVRDRSKHLPFRFVWYALDYEQERAIANGYHFANQFFYFSKVMEFLEGRHFKKKFVIIGSSYGGSIAHSLLSVKQYEKHLGLTDLIIFEGAQILNPSFAMDNMVRFYYSHLDSMWKNRTDVSIGLVTFSGGLRDREASPASTRVRRAVHVPAWSIEGVPDAGLWEHSMLTCAPFINHVADLLIEYGTRQKEASGKEIVRKFYSDFEWVKIERLPVGWNKDWLQFASTIRTGEKYDINVTGQSWVQVMLDRDEYIQMRINGDCLKSVTLVRGRKHVRRKENPTDSEYFNIGIFDAKRFEDIRLLLESGSSCDITIETSSPWWKYGTRFYNGFDRDVHNAFVGALVTGMYFLVLEGDRRSVRYRKQFELYAFLIVATLYHAFHTFGFSTAGFLVGAVLYIWVFLIFSGLQHVAVYRYKRSLEGQFLYDHHEMATFAVISAVITVFAQNYGFISMMIAFLLRNRTFLVLSMILPLAPMLMRTFNSTYHFTANYFIGAQVYSIFTVMFHFFLRHYDIIFPRNIMYNVASIILTSQMLLSDYSLEVHYAIDLFLLVLINNSPNETPQEFKKPVINLSVLEEQYEDFEKENREEEEDDEFY